MAVEECAVHAGSAGDAGDSDFLASVDDVGEGFENALTAPVGVPVKLPISLTA